MWTSEGPKSENLQKFVGQSRELVFYLEIMRILWINLNKSRAWIALCWRVCVLTWAQILGRTEWVKRSYEESNLGSSKPQPNQAPVLFDENPWTKNCFMVLNDCYISTVDPHSSWILYLQICLLTKMYLPPKSMSHQQTCTHTEQQKLWVAHEHVPSWD